MTYERENGTTHEHVSPALIGGCVHDLTHLLDSSFPLRAEDGSVLVYFTESGLEVCGRCAADTLKSDPAEYWQPEPDRVYLDCQDCYKRIYR